MACPVGEGCIGRWAFDAFFLASHPDIARTTRGSVALFLPGSLPDRPPYRPTGFPLGVETLDSATPTMDTPARTALDRRRLPSCLIVEDQALIGMALEADLEDAGLRPSEPLRSKAAALAWLAVETPDLAILDFRLTDGDCTDVATELTRRRVPLVFYSGCPQEPGLPLELRHAPWIEKPCERTALLAALAAAAPLLFVDGVGSPQPRAGGRAVLAAV